MTLETYDEVVEAVYQRIKDEWDPDTAMIVRENTAQPEGDDPWILVTTEILRAPQTSLGQPGNRRFQRRGVVRLVVHVPTDEGSQRSNQITQAVVDLFEGVTMDGVHFFEASPRPVGTDGRWFLQMVEALFHYDQIK